MSEEKPDLLSELLKLSFDAKDKQSQSVSALLSINLATITLLIDNDLTTIEEAAQRIEQIHRSLSGEKDRPVSDLIIQTATDWLRSHDTKDDPRWIPVVIQGDHE